MFPELPRTSPSMDDLVPSLGNVRYECAGDNGGVRIAEAFGETRHRI